MGLQIDSASSSLLCYLHASSALELYLMLLIRLQSMTEALETEVKNRVSIKVTRFFLYTVVSPWALQMTV